LVLCTEKGKELVFKIGENSTLLSSRAAKY
jgi:hypothetical protein